MQLKMFSIRDNKGETYNTPYFAKTLADGERQFHRITNDPQSMINKYPDDFDLYEVGEFCSETGKVEKRDTPNHVAKAINVLMAKQ